MARILIVDDEWLTRQAVEEMLTGLGYEVVGQAESGREAVDMARELKPDLILMDVVMPGEIDGRGDRRYSGSPGDQDGPRYTDHLHLRIWRPRDH